MQVRHAAKELTRREGAVDGWTATRWLTRFSLREGFGRRFDKEAIRRAEHVDEAVQLSAGKGAD